MTEKPESTRSAPATPVVVVSGFLGSGKTSLVRHLLTQAKRDGIRVAVISNELGELGIDRALLGSGESAFVEIEGGCVCCELSNDLVDTLQLLHEQVDPDRIVVETSGVALPFDTQLNFWREPVAAWLGEDTAVVVVSARQLLDERDLEDTFRDQVTSADLLILNKIDLVPPAALEELEAKLRDLEPEAPILRAEHGELSADLLFPPSPAEIDRSGAPPLPRPHGHEAFETEVIEIDAGVDPSQLASLLDDPRLLRAKGFAQTSEGMRLVQLVGRRLEIDVPPAPPPEELVGKLVLIRRVSPPHDDPSAS